MDGQTCRERIKSNIDYDWLATQRKDYEMEEIDELVALIADTVCSTKPTVKIGGDEIPIEEVRQRFLRLTKLEPELQDMPQNRWSMAPTRASAQLAMLPRPGLTDFAGNRPKSESCTAQPVKLKNSRQYTDRQMKAPAAPKEHGTPDAPGR